MITPHAAVVKHFPAAPAVKPTPAVQTPVVKHFPAVVPSKGSSNMLGGNAQHTHFNGDEKGICHSSLSDGLPYPDSAIVRARGDARAVGRPGHASDPLGMPIVDEDDFVVREKFPSMTGVPYLHGLIVAG